MPPREGDFSVIVQLHWLIVYSTSHQPHPGVPPCQTVSTLALSPQTPTVTSLISRPEKCPGEYLTRQVAMTGSVGSQCCPAATWGDGVFSKMAGDAKKTFRGEYKDNGCINYSQQFPVTDQICKWQILNVSNGSSHYLVSHQTDECWMLHAAHINTAHHQQYTSQNENITFPHCAPSWQSLDNINLNIFIISDNFWKKVEENLPVGFRLCHADWLTARDGDRFA